MEFRSIYDDYYRCIYRFVHRMISNSEEAADITQETFTRLFEVISTNGHIDHVSPWLYRVATNLAHNRLTSESRRSRILHARTTELVHKISPEEEYIEHETIRQTRAALSQLSQRDQTMLLLYQDHLPYAQIAEIVGVKPSSVGKLLQRAIERLASQLKSRVES